MEREGVKRGLENLNADHVKVVELITDASTSVKGLLG
jgi:ribonuclease HI